MFIARPHRYGAMMPIARRVWQRPRDQEFWHLDARLHDGALVWRGYFDDREDADAFLFAALTGALDHERELWRLPLPRYEPLPYPVTWQIFTDVPLTTPVGSNATYNHLPDYDAASSVWNVIGGGGSGAFGVSASLSGGGGGGFSRTPGLSLGASATYFIGTGGATRTASGPGFVGGNTWFNGASYAAAPVAAQGGGPGVSGAATPAPGGAAASGIGTLKTSGGASALGGGGAGGQDGNGKPSVGNTGGDGNNSLNGGGAGGAPGAAGSNLAPGFGSGGGGNGNGGTTSVPGQPGGNYGGGGGSCNSFVAASTGAGKQGLIFGVYTPGGSSLIYQFNRAGL